jgi:hypothetical protein
MSGEDFRYLTQDFCWNAHDSRFELQLHSNVFFPDAIDALGEARYDLDGEAKWAIFHGPQMSAIVHCTCKEGNPNQQITVQFESETSLCIRWPGVTRIFARVRIMESSDNDDNMVAMLQDDIEGGHSVSDVENPHQNQSRRPWSDEEDSETDTLNEES